MYMKYDNSLINYFNAYSYNNIITLTTEAFISLVQYNHHDKSFSTMQLTKKNYIFS